MIWLNFLHLYQPANTDFYNIRTALDKSYLRLLRLVEEHPDLKMTFNISGCLLERLVDAKEDSFLERLKFLVKKKRIELTGSAYYHGFLPLLPEKEVIRQIRANEKILKNIFGDNFKPAGFFLPEMAYSASLAKIIKKLGYQWIILDEIAFSKDLKNKPDINTLYVDEASGLKVVFRHREASSCYPPDNLQELLKLEKKEKKEEIILTATDAELYGLRHEDPTAELEKVVKIESLKTKTISSYLANLPKKAKKTKLFPSSWESTPRELKASRPYALWQDKNNKIQDGLWRVANLALSLDDTYRKDKNYYWYRWHLSRGLASCTFWWASARDFSKIFGPYAWSPDDIERGLDDMVRSIRSLNNKKTRSKKLAVERYSLKIKKLIWEKHWKHHWAK